MLLGSMALCLASCRDEIVEPSSVDVSPEGAPVGNVELSIEAALGQESSIELSPDDALKSVTLQAGTSAGRKRPHIVLAEGEQIPGYLIFAYASRGADGNITGEPTVLASKPKAITFTAKAAKSASQSGYNQLEALRQVIDLSEIDQHPDKVWFVSGVIGARYNEQSKLLEFDPNSSLMGAQLDAVAHGEKRRVSIPYTFGWQQITFERMRKTDYNQVREVRSARMSGVRFRPRGLFVRFNVKNETAHSLYVLKSLRFPTGQAFSPKVSLQFPTRLNDFVQGKENTFAALAPTQAHELSFPFGEKRVKIKINEGAGEKYVTVQDYKYYLGSISVTNPYIINNPPRQTDFFWVWLGDLRSDASTYTLELVGESLGSLRNNHKVHLRNIQIPSGRVGYTVARTIRVEKSRPYTPLEFVSRGNLVRAGYGDWNDGTTTIPGSNEIHEVGPQYGYAGSSFRGQWLPGSSFSLSEVWRWDQWDASLHPNSSFQFPNRFIPEVEDIRTIIPIFRHADVGMGYADDREKDAARSNNSGYRYYEKVEEDIMGANNNVHIFGDPESVNNQNTQQAFISGQRIESVRIHDWDGDGTTRVTPGQTDYRDLRMQANYARLDKNTIVGTRFLRHDAASFEDRRKYFCAYSLEFTPYNGQSNPGGLKIRSVYIGTDRLNATATPAVDEEAWMQQIRERSWWEEKESQGEVIERIFPLSGFQNPGGGLGVTEGDDARYFVQSVWGTRRNDWLAFFIHKRGLRLQLWNPGSKATADDMLLRYFVLSPRTAFEKWGSRN